MAIPSLFTEKDSADLPSPTDAPPDATLLAPENFTPLQDESADTTPPTGSRRWSAKRPRTSSTLSRPKSSRSKSSNRTSVEDRTAEFAGNLSTDDDIPSLATLKKIDDYLVLDKYGRSHPFRDLYTGQNSAERVMIIFIRHFYCGNCQEYIRSITASISPCTLLQLPNKTTICIIGHGDPSLIQDYLDKTGCQFPVYADPSKKLYDELGMFRTLNLGSRPEYQRKGLPTIMTASLIQSLKNIKGGKLFKGGDYYQVGGEFLFEPQNSNASTPIWPSESDDESKEDSTDEEPEKRITWCHRMRNTRDHAEIPELMEVLGLDGEGASGPHTGRWSKALGERKGTALSESAFSGRTMVEGRGSDEH